MFVRSQRNAMLRVDNMLDSSRLMLVVGNRARLRSIIKAIFSLGARNIPLRGHRGKDRIDVAPDVPTEEINSRGNCRVLLRNPRRVAMKF